ncbi:MAG: glycogen/starch synthase [Clostridium sp.]|nr:MAG: glycogen/starch synthase [Clostridium sp.]
MGALPQSLKENGCDVRVIMPYYKKIKEKNIASYCGYAYVRINNRQEYVGVMQAVYNGITYYFIDNERYFGRDNLYGYDDDGERFAYFDFAVLEAIKVINFYPDVLHCNDWQTGLIPYIIKKQLSILRLLYKCKKTMLSIHNIQYQGQYSMDLLKILFFYLILIL